TRVITFIAFTATLIFSQNMLSVSSQIGVGDWEFWIDWKDYAWAPFVYTWLVAVHFPVYSYVFNKFFKVYFGSTLVLMFFFLQRNLMVHLFYVGMNNYPFNYVQLPSYLLPPMATDFTLILFGLYLCRPQGHFLRHREDDPALRRAGGGVTRWSCQSSGESSSTCGTTRTSTQLLGRRRGSSRAWRRRISCCSGSRTRRSSMW